MKTTETDTWSDIGQPCVRLFVGHKEKVSMNYIYRSSNFALYPEEISRSSDFALYPGEISRSSDFALYPGEISRSSDFALYPGEISRSSDFALYPGEISRSSDFALYPGEISRSSYFALYREEWFIFKKTHFLIMSQYDLKLDPIINVGHSDLYFMCCDIFCLIS